jgi:CheY-like chemotaxis protein
MSAYRRHTRRPSDAPPRIIPQRVAGVNALSIGLNAENLRLMLRILSHLGLRRASEFPLCAETLEKILASRPDLLIVDFAERPGLAIKLLSMIRHRAFPLNEIPVIAVVDVLTSRGAEALMRAGVDHIVTRPLSPATIYLRIEHAMRAPREFVTTGPHRRPRRRTGVAVPVAAAVPEAEITPASDLVVAANASPRPTERTRGRPISLEA